ncbi:DUF937 domain-containing protein [Streptomyces sp. NPDC093970]|uniref:DUF937 domain-containing protein n=1 Tax=unclassified Streptomyces TaxID=2593676 RepID=UPI003431EBF9
MSESSFQDDVLDEIGDDRIDEIAALLSTDADGARAAVAEAAGGMAGGLREKAAHDDDDGTDVRQAFAEVAEPPLQGVATLGGLGGGMMAGVLAKLSRPVANAVSKKTGIPAPTVARIIDVLIPVLLSVFAKRAADARNTGSGAAAGSGTGPGSGGLGDLLGQILGGGRK